MPAPAVVGTGPGVTGGDAGGADDPVVQVRAVTKRFGSTVALDDVSLTVGRGQMVALIGLSGSGKSTLLRHLNGLHHPTAGDVDVLGTDVVHARRRELRSLRRRVGFVFQQFGLVGRATCLENVLSGALGRLRGPRFGVVGYRRADRREALAQLDRVGLADRAFQRADTLSGGQQQRVAIARTLMQSPDLLLADEPVASLDPESSAQVMDVLFRVCLEDRLTVVCSLHQVELALGWAHRIVGLRDGRVVLDEDADSLDAARVMDVYRRVEPGAGDGSTEADADADAADGLRAAVGGVRPGWARSEAEALFASAQPAASPPAPVDAPTSAVTTPGADER